MVFHWSLGESKSPQVSRTLLSILAVFNNAVVCMVSTHPPTSKSSRPFNNPLVTKPKETITIGTIVTLMFHSFFNSLARSRYLCLLYGLVFWPRLGNPCVCQSPIGVYVCHFLGQVLVCACTFCSYCQI